MNPAEIIKKKRNGGILSRNEIKFFIESYLKGEISDYQMSAFLMSVYFRGMNDDETFYLTEVQLNSGLIVDLSDIKGVKVDKHSTGGVGDKTSIILAPQVASCGVIIPMISGRGLGHTGGTLDKLESIPGFRVDIDISGFKDLLGKEGVALIGQTSELAPADKRIYAIRDVTATVDNISLITASILSKKIAEGADAIVFDVKIGNGANLPDRDESRKLAENLISVSRKFGKKAVAILTDMEEPLGYKIGNWLEIEECLEVMNGKYVNDLIKVNNILAGTMFFLAGVSNSIAQGEILAYQSLNGSKVYEKFLKIVKAQGGDVDYVKDYKNLKRPALSKKIIASSSGYISEMNAQMFGMAAIDLGCGRKKADDKIDYLAGIELKKKCGQKVETGETLAVLWASSDEKLNSASERINNAINITDNKPEEKQLIIDILGA